MENSEPRITLEKQIEFCVDNIESMKERLKFARLKTVKKSLTSLSAMMEAIRKSLEALRGEHRDNENIKSVRRE